jgi:hypothetical protein
MLAVEAVASKSSFALLTAYNDLRIPMWYCKMTWSIIKGFVALASHNPKNVPPPHGSPQ